MCADALGHHQAGRLNHAEQLYRQILAIDPRIAEMHSNLGEALRVQGKLGEAVACHHRALNLKPDYVQAYNNLGNALKDQGKLDEAVAQYQRAISIRPDFAEAYLNLGNALCYTGKLDEAVAQYQRALAFRPDFALAHDNLGNTLRDLGKLDEAVAHYRRAVALRPDFAQAYNNLGNTLIDQGKLAEAVAQYQRAISIRPDFAEAYLSMGNAFKELGRLADAEASYRRALDNDPGDTLGARLLLASLGPGQMPMRASEAHLEKLYVIRSRNWDLGQTYFGHQLVAEAIRKLPHEPKKLDILDAGCGTGLVGVLVRDLANRLDGIDMSSAMLEKAREKNIYDHTYLADLFSFMADHSNSYDAVACAATLIHFGDLTSVFHAAASSLRDDGLFVFTLFPNDSGHNNQEVAVHPNSSLATAGCFAHSSSYVSRLAEAAGFSVEVLEQRIHEYHKTVPIMGLVVALRRRPRLTP
jgi:predicted TPR repeat methyltransferase